MASILRVDTIQPTGGPSITVPSSYNLLASGLVIQVKNINNNYNWGSWGSQAEMEMPWMDITLSTKGNNSSFFISAQMSTDDTNSAAYGIGIGAKYSTNGGTSWTWIRYPALHENYDSGGIDHYRINAMTMTTDKLGISAGTSMIFRPVSRFNNSNAQHFGGNGGLYYAQMHTIMEIAA